MSFRSALRRVALAALLAVPLAVSTNAQEVQRIAAVVNDEVVSMFDLVERVKLEVLTRGLDNTPEIMQRLAPQVLRALIDELLRLQEAKRKNVLVTDDEMRQRIRLVEQRNQLAADSFDGILRSRQIDPETFFTQLRSEIAWLKLVQQRVQSNATVSEEDIDDELERLRDSQGKPQLRYSEIYLIVERADHATVVRQNAERLVEQIRGGGDFIAIARQFSEVASASQGGDVGWVLRDQLAEEVAAALVSLRPGEVSDPIQTAGGFLIVQLRDRRQVAAPDPDEAQVELKQILLRLPENAGEADIETLVALASAVRETVADCNDMSRAASEIGPGASADLGLVRIKDLPPDIKSAARGLPVGAISQPVRTVRGIHLLMACNRIDPPSTLPDRDQVRQAVIENRFDRESRRYLRDLRRSAFIDIRI